MRNVLTDWIANGWGSLTIAALAAVLVVGLFMQRRTPGRGAVYGRPRTLDAVDTVIGWAPEATRALAQRHLRAFQILQRALPGHLILAQVPISQFVRVPARNSYVEWLRRVGHVSVDLMVCDRDAQVLAVIAVRASDRTDSERSRKRHARVERVLRAAGIPLHVWNEELLPEPAAVRRAFAPELSSRAAEADTGPDTSPMDAEPAATAPWRAGAPRRDPPRSTWFDDLHATRPMPIDGHEDDAGAPSVLAPVALTPRPPRP